MCIYIYIHMYVYIYIYMTLLFVACMANLPAAGLPLLAAADLAEVRLYAYYMCIYIYIYIYI